MSFISQKRFYRSIVVISVSMLFIYNLALTVFKLQTNDIVFMDFHAQWQESAYPCKGLNPYKVNDLNSIDSIGIINPQMITVPWAWLIGMLINPGFLPYGIAKIIGVIIYIGTYLITSAVLANYWLNNIVNNRKKDLLWVIFPGFLLGAQIYWWWSIICGNQGAIIACIIIICLCLYKKHPIISGLLMTVAMVKTQLTAIFYVLLLLQKEYKLIFTSIISGLVSFLSVSLITKSTFVELLLQTFQSGSKLDGVFYGLFDVMKFFNAPIVLILFADIVCGLLYVLLYWKVFNNKNCTNIFVLFSGVAIASTFWFYKQPHDNIILAIPCIAYLYIAYVTDKRRDYFKCIINIFILVGAFYIQGAVQIIFRFFKCSIQPEMATSIGKTIYCICLIICGFSILKFKESFALTNIKH